MIRLKHLTILCLTAIAMTTIITIGVVSTSQYRHQTRQYRHQTRQEVALSYRDVQIARYQNFTPQPPALGWGRAKPDFLQGKKV